MCLFLESTLYSVALERAFALFEEAEKQNISGRLFSVKRSYLGGRGYCKGLTMKGSFIYIYMYCSTTCMYVATFMLVEISFSPLITAAKSDTLTRCSVDNRYIPKFHIHILYSSQEVL